MLHRPEHKVELKVGLMNFLDENTSMKTSSTEIEVDLILKIKSHR